LYILFWLHCAKKFATSWEALQTAWNVAARKAGAAAIFIVNDVDEEEVPPMVQDFEYCEDIYIWYVWPFLAETIY
jgi:histone-lysine N-methyltransferase SUV39H